MMPFNMSKWRELNIRDLGEILAQHSSSGESGGKTVARGLLLRSGKLSILGHQECAVLFQKYRIKCVIDLRTPIESAEYPDPLPNGVTYHQIPLLKDASVGITHETGSDPMTILKSLRKHPEKLKAMIPDFESLYTQIVTDSYSRAQLDKAVSILRENVERGVCTLFHCTAGKDRTGLVSMALLKSYGVSNEVIIEDYMRTNRNAFWPTIKKCAIVWMLTQNWELVRTAYKAYMADRKLIETAIQHYDSHS